MGTRVENGNGMEHPDASSVLQRGAGQEHVMTVKDSPNRSGTAAPAGAFRKRHKKCLTCCGVTVAVIVAIMVVLVIVIFTVFKAKDPTIRVNQVVVEGISIGFEIPSFQPRGNLTLGLSVSVKNPNKVSFKYHNSTAFLFYRTTGIGEVPIGAGEMKADKTVTTNLTATILVDRLLANPNFSADLLAQTLPLTTKATVTGKINILNIYKKHATASSSCNTTIFLNNSTTGPNDCDYKTSL